MTRTAHPMPLPVAVLALIVGLAIGSFLNVCIHRIPAGQSIVWPGSRCPACAAPIVWYDNVPLLSWVRLGGRCRACRAPIAARYPVVEAVTGALALLSVARFGIAPWAVVAFAFSCAMLVVSFIDLDEGIIPDVVSLPGILVGLAVSALVPGGPGFWNAFAGACLGGGLLLAVATAYQRRGHRRARPRRRQAARHDRRVRRLAEHPGRALIASITGSLGGVAILLGPRGRASATGRRVAPAGGSRPPLSPHAPPLRPVPRTRRRHGALRSRSRPALDLGVQRLTDRRSRPDAPSRPDDVSIAEVRIARLHRFTPFELLSRLARVAIAGGAALRLPDVLAAVRLGGAAQRLSAALRQARGHALEHGGPVEVALDDARQAWEVREVSATTLAREALPPGVTFASLPASRRVRFTALGTTDNATITLGAGATVRRIVVNQRGRVRVQ